MGLIDTHCHLDMLKGTPDEALANAPARDGHFFAVPKVLEQDSA